MTARADLTLALGILGHATAQTIDVAAELLDDWAQSRVEEARRDLDRAVLERRIVCKAIARACDRLTPPTPQEPPC